MLFVASFLCGFKLDRVILSTDKNPIYLDNWPVVAKAWQDLIGLRPTLAFIADDEVEIDESLGDVVRFKPIPGVPDGFYAQVVRLLMPAMYPNDVCIISDIDMMPLSKDYFVKSVVYIGKEYFVIYRRTLFYSKEKPEYAMCYIAAAGKLFQQLFDLKSVKDIESKVKEWYDLGLGWATDQLLLYQQVHKNIVPIKRLNHQFTRRIDRWIGGDNYFCGYEEKKLKNNYYIDFHLPRPYKKFEEGIWDIYYKALASSKRLKKG